MKAHYRSRNNRMTFEIEGGNLKALFEGIAELQDIFEAEESCGLCNSTDLRFRVRDVSKDGKKYKYYELVCGACHARFDFGQTQEGGALFPKRKDRNGDWLPDRGWYKWQGTRRDDEETPF